jgi:hypothetical protein
VGGKCWSDEGHPLMGSSSFNLNNLCVVHYNQNALSRRLIVLHVSGGDQNVKKIL